MQKVVSVRMILKYRLELLIADKPRIRIIIPRPDQHQETFNVFSQSAEVLIRISRDCPNPSQFVPFSMEKLVRDRPTVAIAIRSEAPSYIRPQNPEHAGELSLCHLVSQHHPNTANRFFELCKTTLAESGQIPITFLSPHGNVVCTLESKRITRFSWEETSLQSNEEACEGLFI